MAQLYFYYGCMGCSKTAQALMMRFNYEQQGKKVALLKPTVDTRTPEGIVQSRIGLRSEAISVRREDNISRLFVEAKNSLPDIIIVDEAQFLTERQVDQLKDLALAGFPVLCYGLKTDFQTHLFEGSKRLIEIADSIQEIPILCKCGRKAEVNARISGNRIIKTGNQILIGDGERYRPMCYRCWKNNLI